MGPTRGRPCPPSRDLPVPAKMRAAGGRRRSAPGEQRRERAPWRPQWPCPHLLAAEGAFL